MLQEKEEQTQSLRGRKVLCEFWESGKIQAWLEYGYDRREINNSPPGKDFPQLSAPPGSARAAEAYFARVHALKPRSCQERYKG